MSCTFENGVGCVMGNEILRFGSLDQVLNDDDLKRFDQGMSRRKDCSSMAATLTKVRGHY